MTIAYDLSLFSLSLEDAVLSLILKTVPIEALETYKEPV